MLGYIKKLLSKDKQPMILHKLIIMEHPSAQMIVSWALKEDLADISNEFQASINELIGDGEGRYTMSLRSIDFSNGVEQVLIRASIDGDEVEITKDTQGKRMAPHWAIVETYNTIVADLQRAKDELNV